MSLSRKSKALRALLLAAFACACAAPIPAAAPARDEPFQSAGHQLAARVRQLQPEQETRISGQLKIRRRGEPLRTIPLHFAVQLQPGFWTLDYLTAATPKLPAQRLSIVCSPDSTNRYRFAAKPADAPAWPEPQGLPRTELDAPLADSDFWFLDLGMDFLHWPGQRMVKAEMRRGRPCRVLESTPSDPADQGYGRVVTWLDNETGRPIQAEAYDPNDQLLKEFSLDSFKRVDGQWQLESMKIRNVQTRSTTWIEFDLE